MRLQVSIFYHDNIVIQIVVITQKGAAAKIL